MTQLEQLVLEGHVVLGLEADASPEDVDQSGPLLAEGVDDRSAGRRQGRLEHVAQHAENAVEALEVAVALGAPLDAGHELGNNDEVDDEGRRQQRVLAHVEDAAVMR